MTTIPTPSTVAIYCRSATDDSIETQRQRCVAGLLHHDARQVISPVRYDDTGSTGMTTDRPALQRLLADAQAGMIQAVAMTALDRLSRSLPHLADLLQVLHHHEIAVLTVTDRGVTTLPLERLMRGLRLGARTGTVS